MIVTVADLLQSLMKKEKELIKQYEIVGHGPTIGDMYEGLTTNLLNKAIFQDLDIRIASGKIRNSQGEFSNEVDCMIVEGEGDAIPYTDKFIYDISQVIAVLEIKKNLYKGDLIDSYKKMQRIYQISEPDPKSVNMKGLRDAFRHIVKKELPNYEVVETLPFHEQMIYHSLLMEEMLPVRIVFGYYGYNSEYSLREAFFKYITDESGNRGYSPVIFPDLIICGNNSLAKLDAMPYIGFIDKNDFWNFYASSVHNPLLLLLEVIWTRLSYNYNIDNSIFGDDLDFEAFHPYLSGKARMLDSVAVWEINYHFIERKNLVIDPIYFEWKPAELDEPEWFIINWLCKNGVLDVSEPGFVIWLNEKGADLKKIVESLTKKGLITFQNNQFSLLTDRCEVVAVNNKWYAAENKAGRLTNWVNRMLKLNEKDDDSK